MLHMAVKELYCRNCTVLDPMLVCLYDTASSLSNSLDFSSVCKDSIATTDFIDAKSSIQHLVQLFLGMMEAVWQF